MSFRSWLDDAHVSESELAALIAGKPFKSTAPREPDAMWLDFRGGLHTASITPPRTWAYIIESIQVYCGSVPAASIIPSVNITQEAQGPGSAISSFYYEGLVTAAEGGALNLNLIPDGTAYRHAATSSITLTVPLPGKILYGTQTLEIAVSGATWNEGLMLYRKVEMA